MEQDKYHAMAVIAAGSGGLREDQVAGLAHIFRQIARDAVNAERGEILAWLKKQSDDEITEFAIYYDSVSDFISART